MAPSVFPLEKIQVASPCTVSWETMSGDGRVRYCSKCSNSVYHLSEMTREQAQALIVKEEGRLCVRYFQRADGTVMTRDCPESSHRRRHLLKAGALVLLPLLLVSLFLFLLLFMDRPSQARTRLRHVEPFRAVFDWFDPPVVMGKLCLPPPPNFVPPGPNPQEQENEELPQE
jgi:hypothetical protein